VILLAWDPALFRAIHSGLHHPALDPIMMALTDPGRWKIPLLILAGALFLTRRARGILALVVLILTLTVADQVSAKVIKPLVKRPRPSVVLADSHPLFGVRRSYAFPSVHAVNFTAAVPIVATVFPGAGVPAAALAALVCFSRVYVGDHWPSDVLGGVVLGLGLGFLGRKAFLRLEQNARRWIRPAEEGAGGEPSAAP
jgi:undecaprenyl-diphosphatase